MQSKILSGDKRERGFTSSNLKLADGIDGSVWWERAPVTFTSSEILLVLRVEYI